MTLTRILDVPSGNAVNGKVHLRTLSLSDVGPLAAAYTRNAEHLAPWEPRRSEAFYTKAGQEAVVRSKLNQYAAGTEVPWVVLHDGDVIGLITLTGIVRGPFLNANLGYWVDQAFTGNGIATSSVQAALSMAGDELGLHRIQAATLVHNAASQAVLKRSGFERIGLAPSYLHIAGKWQAHVLYQRILF
ncbi:GNAT family N-acetyltransferase [Paenarthrobacter sp. RAF54_2]|uniref:GNAT family N-acetyltransferase n=1 Tax=Paenarthrobacter sp. RAF54_2 TaxID=3233061 RepID=UPI003F9C0768